MLEIASITIRIGRSTFVGDPNGNTMDDWLVCSLKSGTLGFGEALQRKLYKTVLQKGFVGPGR